jgi:hypothetical protein
MSGGPWRRRAASRQILFDEFTSTETVPDPADRSADHAEVNELLGRLPRRQRTAIVLHYYSGWSDQLSSTPDLRWTDFSPAASLDDTSTWFPATIAIP